MRRQHTSPIIRLALGICIAGIFLIGMFAQASRSQETTSAAARGLNFPHEFHRVDVELECAACHAAKASTTGRDDLLPGHDQCSDCHAMDEPDDCSICHLSDEPELSPRLQKFSPKFSHEYHSVEGKLACNACHTDLDGFLSLEQVGHLPDMAQCMTCHEQSHVSNACAECHLPTDDLEPANHKLNWMNLHGSFASASQDECALCHSVAEDCQACHNGDEVSMPHPNNYVSTHGFDAHLSDMTCGVCHDQRDFCNECHRSLNILPADHFRGGWVTASGGVHSEEAKFDLESCMSCHEAPEQEPICALCHGE